MLPWYAWAMVPLSLANALVNNLLARSQFRIVPVLVVLAVAYGVALTQFHDSLVTVLKTLGVFNLLLFAACGWFTWLGGNQSEDGRWKIEDGGNFSILHLPFSIFHSLSSFFFFLRRAGQRLRRAQFLINPAFQRTQRLQPFVKRRINQPDAHTRTKTSSARNGTARR